MAARDVGGPSVTTAALCGVLVILPQLRSQILASPTFEVATVRSSPPPKTDLINIILGNFRGGRLTFTNASLSDCLKYAYDIVSDDQIVGPDWIKSKAVRFDIVAQAPPDTPLSQVQAMLRSLVADRLKVALHHENKNLSYLALVISKNGPKIHEAKLDATSPPKSTAMLGRISSNQMPMPRLAMLLSRFERQMVIDQTGLSGAYEVQLEWTHQPTGNVMSATDAADAPAGPSVFTAVQEQLGLRLESRHGPVDVLVIDHAEQTPTEN